MAKRDLTLMADGRWRKKHKGRIYYFRGAYREALDQWQQKLAGLRDEPPPEDSTLSKWRKRVEWAKRQGNHDLAQSLQSILDGIKEEARETGKSPRSEEHTSELQSH